MPLKNSLLKKFLTQKSTIILNHQIEMSKIKRNNSKAMSIKTIAS